tara:strand:- start:23778 stop:24926 length:1149 start_codon:yes stop_codon:yes gene_type:complete
MYHLKLKKISVSLFAILGFSTALSANSEVYVYKNNESKMVNTEAQFSQVGISGESAELIPGYGKDMPFSLALEILVPSHWDVSYNEGADNLLVNWAAKSEEGTPWPYLLKDLSEKNNVSVSINWTNKTVDFFAHNVVNNQESMLANNNTEKATINREEKEINNELLQKENEEYQTIVQRLQQELEDQKVAINENQKVIEDLIAAQNKTEQEKELLKEKTEELKKLQENYEDNKEVISSNQDVAESNNDNLNKKDPISEIDIEDFRKDYEKRYVLPLNSSFDFYVDGGYRQEFDFYTPATFIAKKGDTIKKVMSEWAESIDWDSPAYETNAHYTLDYEIKFEGTIREAAVSLINLYKDTARPLDIKFYPNQKIILIKDLEYKN